MRAIRTVASLVPAASPRGNGAAAQPFYRSDIMTRQEQKRTLTTTHQRYNQQDMMQERNESGASGAPEPEPSNQLFVANISYGIRAEDLEREFAEFGKVVSAKIIYDPRGLSKGYEAKDFLCPSVSRYPSNKQQWAFSFMTYPLELANFIPIVARNYLVTVMSPSKTLTTPPKRLRS